MQITFIKFIRKFFSHVVPGITPDICLQIKIDFMYVLHFPFWGYGGKAEYDDYLTEVGGGLKIV